MGENEPQTLVFAFGSNGQARRLKNTGNDGQFVVLRLCRGCLLMAERFAFHCVGIPQCIRIGCRLVHHEQIRLYGPDSRRTMAQGSWRFATAEEGRDHCDPTAGARQIAIAEEIVGVQGLHKLHATSRRQTN